MPKQELQLGNVPPTPPTPASPLINDTDADFSGRGEYPLGEAVGDRGQGIVLNTLISGYITSDFYTF